jgi:hypothetical protein
MKPRLTTQQEVVTSGGTFGTKENVENPSLCRPLGSAGLIGGAARANPT